MQGWARKDVMLVKASGIKGLAARPVDFSVTGLTKGCYQRL